METKTMIEDMDEIEILIWMEKRFGPLQKTLVGGYSMDKADAAQSELFSLLHRHHKQLNLQNPMPKIRAWRAHDDKLNFLFFDKYTGKRILLGDWLTGKETFDEQ
jgi:hypothetical protein